MHGTSSQCCCGNSEAQDGKPEKLFEVLKQLNNAPPVSKPAVTPKPATIAAEPKHNCSSVKFPPWVLEDPDNFRADGAPLGLAELKVR